MANKNPRAESVDFDIAMGCVDEEKIYILHYHPYPRYEHLGYSSEGQTHSHDRQHSAFVLLRCPGRTITVYHSPATLRRVSIAFSHQWLLGQLRDVRDDSRASDYILQVVQTVAEQAPSKGEAALVQFLFDAFRGRPFLLEVKAYVYHLISFLYRQVSMRAHR